MIRTRFTLLSRPLMKLRAISNLPSGTSDSSSKPHIERFHETMQLPYTSEQLYKLVIDVGSYPTFIPFCQDCRVIRQSKYNSDNDGHSAYTKLDAVMKIGYGLLTESYDSQLICIPYESVKVGLMKSTYLFEWLESEWKFYPVRVQGRSATGHLSSEKSGHGLERPEAWMTKVSLDMAYAFASPVYANLVSGILGPMAEIMVKSFEDRARLLYG